MRKSLVVAMVLAALPLFARPDVARAQSVDLGSSMTATCVGVDCSVVRFFLDLTGSSTVDIVRITSQNGALWQFSGLLGVRDGNGNNVTANWIAGVTSGNLQLKAATVGSPSPDPMAFTVSMAVWGTQNQLFGGNLTYTGQGFDAAGNLGSFAGTVTPEPGTTLLLGTGLALLGLVGVVRRRKQSLEG